MMNKVEIEGKTFEVYLTEEQIKTEIARIAKLINEKYADSQPLFISVLNGSFMFTSDLLKCISVECELSFVKLSSYEGTSTTGEVKEIVGLNQSIKGRKVIILEDIVDTGYTMQMLLKQLKTLEPASIEVASLLSKPDALKVDIEVDYICFEIPEKFVVGYGLDLNGLGRNLPNIYQLK